MRVFVSDKAFASSATAYSALQKNAAVAKFDVKAAETASSAGSIDTLVDIEDVVGTAMDDSLRGNADWNGLFGGGGNDTLNGDAGNDLLQGDDGNDLLYGEAHNDTLRGGIGNDTLAGGDGDDTLIGETGSDTYTVLRGGGVDTLQENDVTAGNTDVLQFQGDVNANQLWFRKAGNDLEVSVIGTADKVTVSNWYLGAAYHVEQIKSGDGKLLQDTQVDKLVQAMAAFAPPAAGQTTLAANYQAALAPVLAANWT